MKRSFESDLPGSESSNFDPPTDEPSHGSFGANKRVCSEELSGSSSPFSTPSPESHAGNLPDPLRLESSVAIPRPILYIGQLATLPPNSRIPSEILNHLPEFYETVTLVFDFTSPHLGLIYFTRWAGSLGNDLCNHIRRLKFILLDTSDEVPFEGDGLLEACVAVVRGGLCCSLERESKDGGRQCVQPAMEKMLDRKLAKVDDLMAGSGFGVNGIVAIGRAMVG